MFDLLNFKSDNTFIYSYIKILNTYSLWSMARNCIYNIKYDRYPSRPHRTSPLMEKTSNYSTITIQ